MTELAIFTPQAERDAQTNLDDFVHLCATQLTVFGTDLDFSGDVWDISTAKKAKGRDGHTRTIYFSNWATSDKKMFAKKIMLAEPFKAFAKAYIRYQQGVNPIINQHTRLRVLQALEAALLENGTANPVHITAAVFNRADQLLKERCRGSAYYSANRVLNQLADCLLKQRLTTVPTRWQHKARPPRSPDRVGPEADANRTKKMPDPAALDALPHIFRHATAPADVMAASVCALLHAAPNRLNEVLTLPVDCEVNEPATATQPAYYGLRWWPAKGAPPMVKPVLPSWAEVVQEALSKIRQLTDAGRALALWYEEHPDQVYLRPEWAHLRKQEWLSRVEAEAVLWSAPASSDAAWEWCRGKGVEVVTQERRGPGRVRFADLEAAILLQLPQGFPIADATTGLRFSKALFSLSANVLHGSRPCSACLPDRYADGQFRHMITGTKTTSSLFERFDFYGPDGNPLRITSHQFRHYLNTLAQGSGLSQLDIALWSGRRDIRQNRVYDHQTTEALVASNRAKRGDPDRERGPLAASTAQPKVLTLIARDQFDTLKITTAHTTDFGYCLHDFVASPCQLHLDCLNCGEQACVKGETYKEQRIRQAHAEANRLLALAQVADAAGEGGADEWVEYQQLYVDRTTQLLAIIDDPAIPPGTIIRMGPGHEQNRLTQAAEDRARLLTTEGLDT